MSKLQKSKIKIFEYVINFIFDESTPGSLSREREVLLQTFLKISFQHSKQIFISRFWNKEFFYRQINLKRSSNASRKSLFRGRGIYCIVIVPLSSASPIWREPFLRASDCIVHMVKPWHLSVNTISLITRIVLLLNESFFLGIYNPV